MKRFNRCHDQSFIVMSCSLLRKFHHLWVGSTNNTNKGQTWPYLGYNFDLKLNYFDIYHKNKNKNSYSYCICFERLMMHKKLT